MNPKPREVWSWALYDFANSAFATSILAVIYSVYFTKTVAAGGIEFLGRHWGGPALWNFSGALSMGLVCVTAPILGAITDYTAAKKRTFVLYWLAGCLATAALSAVQPGMVLPGMALFIVANIGFAGGNALYNAFLPELATNEKMARLSSLGWGLGYLGGGLCLLVNLVMFNTWGIVRGGFAVVAAWWFVFALPFLFLTRERAVPRPIPAGRSKIALGFSNVWGTLRNIRKYRELFKFLIAYLLFNEGVETVIFNASVYGGKVVGLTQGQLIMIYLVVQVVAIAGAFLFGALAERVAGKRAIVVSLVVWLGVVGFAFFVSSPVAFWILGVLVGLVMGGTQAISRGFFGQLTPKDRTAEFFGFFAIGGKFAAALGPLLFGAVTEATGEMRWGILSIGVFFLAGMILLFSVDEKRGMLEATSDSCGGSPAPGGSSPTPP